MKTVILSLVFSCSTAVMAAPQIDCFDMAVNNRHLSKESAIALCGGATSNAPITCFDFAQIYGLQLRGSMLLCRGAKDAQIIIDCVNLGASRNLSKYETVELCGSTDFAH